MIQLYDTKPCADHMDSVQAEGVISKEHFSLSYFESLLRQIGFRVFSVGNPLVLICRRPDCLLLVNSDGSFNISEVSSNEKLLQVVDEIRNQIIIRRPIFESMFVCT